MRRVLPWVLLALAWPVWAEGLRAFEPIAPPGAFAAPPPGLPVPAEEIERFVQELAAAWNGPQLGSLLADDFPDRQRVVDTLRTELPLDARLRILSIGTIQPLAQHAVSDGRVSEVLVRVRAQVEFRADDGQLRLLPTSQEWVLRIAQRLP